MLNMNIPKNHPIAVAIRFEGFKKGIGRVRAAESFKTNQREKALKKYFDTLTPAQRDALIEQLDIISQL